MIRAARSQPAARPPVRCNVRACGVMRLTARVGCAAPSVNCGGAGRRSGCWPGPLHRSASDTDCLRDRICQRAGRSIAPRISRAYSRSRERLVDALLRVPPPVSTGAVAGASANPGDNMQRAATFFGSSIGKKVVMAASGLVLYGFVIGHMVGNLQIYLGPKAINDYGGVPAALPARPGHLDRPRQPPRGGRPPHLGGGDPDPLELVGPAGGLPRLAGARVDLRVAHDGVERPDPRRLHRLPPRPLHAGHRPPRVREGRRLPQRGRGLPEPVRLRVLRPRDGRPGAAHVPRLLEHAADPRPEPPALEPRCAAPPRWRWPGSWCSPTSRSRWPCSPASSTCRGATMELNANIPSGPIAEKWSKHRFDMKLVNPANKRKYSVIVVGSGLAGGAAAASLAELGYNVKVFCYQDSPRRAHSIAAQGGINAAKNYQNDGDSVLPPLLRHGEGRRLPRARGERLPPRRAVGEHHRPVRGPGRALRPRVRRAPSPTARSAAPRCRARSTRAARPASSCSSAPTRP